MKAVQINNRAMAIYNNDQDHNMEMLDKESNIQWVLRVCDPYYIDVNDQNVTSDNIREAAVDMIEGETESDILMQLIKGLNTDQISDQMFFFLYEVVDGKEYLVS